MSRYKRKYIYTMFTDFYLFVISVLLLFFISYLFIDYISDSSMKDYLSSALKEVPNEFITGRYDDFDSQALGRDSFFIIYDQDNQIVYSSKKDIDYSYSNKEVYLIPNEVNRPIVTVEVFEEFDEKEYLEISREYYLNFEKSGLETIVLDADKNLVYSTIKNIKGPLSIKEIRLLTGLESKNLEVTKMLFEDERKINYTAIFYRKHNPINRVSNSSKSKNGYLLKSFILIFLLSSVTYVIHIDRKVKLPLKMLLESIKEVSFGNSNKLINYKGPYEFENVCKTFNDMQEKLNYSNEKRIEAEKDKIRILADISHDLKTPITAIGGFSQALIDDKVSEEKKRVYYQRIFERAQMLNKLIITFNEYNTLQRPDMSLNLSKKDLSEFIRSYFINKYDEIAIAGYKLDIELNEGIYVELDLFNMTRVFDNIVGNVLKHTSKGTTISCNLIEKKSSIIIKIGDNGKGIEESIRDNIFEALVIGDKARSSKSGTGLGMAIVKQIVSLHGGTIELDDSVGTVYKIELKKVKQG